MKNVVFVFVASFLLLAKVIFGAIWHLHFQLNQQQIIAQECVNKKRPEMQCNGTCYLAKQLKKADLELEKKKSDQQHTLNGMKNIASELFVSCNSTFAKAFIFHNIKNSKQQVPYLNHYCFNFLETIFHPPCARDHT